MEAERLKVHRFRFILNFNLSTAFYSTTRSTLNPVFAKIVFFSRFKSLLTVTWSLPERQVPNNTFRGKFHPTKVKCRFTVTSLFAEAEAVSFEVEPEEVYGITASTSLDATKTKFHTRHLR